MPEPHMQHHLKCGSARIPAIDGDGLILSRSLSVLACWAGAKRSWFVISSPATFSPSLSQGQDMFLQLKTLVD